MLRVGLVKSSPSEIGGGNVYEKEVADLIVSCAPEGLSFIEISKTSKGYRIGDGTGRSTVESNASTSLPIRRFLRGSVRKRNLQEVVDSCGLNLVIFLSPVFAMAKKLSVPTIGTIWDLGAFDLTHMPEFAGDYAIKMRDVVHEATQTNLKILVPTTKFGAEIANRFGISSAKTVATGLPLPSTDMGSESPFPREFPYLIYPAKYWKHKNHATIFKAFQSERIQKLQFRLVLTGIGMEDQRDLAHETKDFGIAERVISLGYISHSMVYRLIADANALLMPSLLGPVNYPPLEALALGTSVIQSDVHDFDSMLPENVSTVPGTDPHAWEEAILNLDDIKSAPKFILSDAHYKSKITEMFEGISVP